MNTLAPDGGVIAVLQRLRREVPMGVGQLQATAQAEAALERLLPLVERLTGFAAHYADETAMDAGGRQLIAETRVALARARGDA